MFPELSDSMRRFRQEMEEVDELVHVLLKGHLLLEEALSRILEQHVFHREHLGETRLSFHHKMLLARSLCLRKNGLGEWELLAAIKPLRNEIAHKLNATSSNIAFTTLSVDHAALPFVDKKRIGAAGASFGGFMINWFQGHTDRFAALFCHAGISDQESMYATEELFFPEHEFGGTPWSSELYRKWSPMTAAAHFATPEMIVHGERDFRVPVEQGLLMFSLLQRKGVSSKLLVFPDENHWVLKPGNSRLWYASLIDWFHRWLGGAAADPKALDSAISVTR